MEIKSELLKPYTYEQRVEFIVEQNHRKGYLIEEREDRLVALGETTEELISDKRTSLLEENTSKAKQAVSNGYVVFKDAQFETNTQTCSDLTSTMLMMQSSGIESYSWLSKDDKVVELTLEDFGTLGGLIATYKATVWNVKYLEFKQQIEDAKTLEELDAIVIDYDVPSILGLMENDGADSGMDSTMSD